MRPIIHAPDCKHYDPKDGRCSCGGTANELIRRHKEWEAKQCAQSPQS